jgi:hypothetical protein
MTSKAWTLEGESELRHFLKVARPKWSKPRQSGPRDIDRVIAKFKEVGVTDIETLLHRIHNQTINRDLEAKGLQPLRPEAIESIRKQGPFLKSLEHVDAHHIRQTGLHAPVPQLLSSKWLLDTKPTVVPLNRSSEDFRRGLASTHAEGFGRKLNNFDSGESESGLSTGEDARFNSKYSLSLRGLHAKPRARFKATRSKMAQSHCQLPFVADAAFGSQATSSSSQLLVPNPQTAERLSYRPMQSESLPQLPAAAPHGPLQSTRALGNAKVCASRWLQHARSPRPVMGEEEENRLIKQMARFQSIGATMTSGKRDARWSSTGSKGPLALGEEMLAEQEALDRRAEIVRLANSSDLSFRSHISRNIQSRIKQELKAQSLQAVNMRQRCQNIDKNLDEMRGLRRELGNLRSQMEVISTDPESKLETIKHEIALGYEARKQSMVDPFEGPTRRDSVVSENVSSYGKTMKPLQINVIHVHVTPGEEQTLKL